MFWIGFFQCLDSNACHFYGRLCSWPSGRKHTRMYYVRAYTRMFMTQRS